MIARHLALFGVLLSTSLACAVASAAEEKSEELALDLFNAGKGLEEKGDFAGACADFEKSVALDIRVGTFARLAQCEEKLGQVLNARAHWARARDLAEGTRDPRAEHAAREYERVDAMVPKLNVTLLGPVPPGFTLTVDADPMGTNALGIPLAVAPGSHTIRAAAPDKRPFEATVDVRNDGAVTPVQIHLLDIASGEAPAIGDTSLEAHRTPAGFSSPAAGEAPPAKPQWGTQKTLALASGGLGVVAVGLGSYFGVQSFAKWSDAKTQCGSGCAGSDQASTSKTDALHDATAADVAFGAATVLLAGAAILWFTSGPREANQKAGLVRIVAVAASTNEVLVTGSFGP